LQSDGTAPVLSVDQRLGARAATRSARDACGVWVLCMRGVTGECAVTRERMTTLGVRERSIGPYLYAPFAAPMTGDRGHRAP
jgi:hypothetical protein